MNHPNPTPEVAAGTPRLAALAKIAVTYGVLLLVWSPALGSDRVNDSFQDWSYAAEYKSYAATSLFEFGEVPYFAWQGRHKGHRNTAFDAFFANPETPALSPMLPLYHWLDHEQATRADRQIRLLVGAVGAYVLLSAWLANVSLWALLSFCLLYLGNGALAGHTLVGHGMAGALFALPLIMGLFLRAANRNHAGLFPVAAVACGGLLALMVYDGASHFLTHFLLFLGIYSVTACIIEPRPSARHWRRAFRNSSQLCASRRLQAFAHGRHLYGVRRRLPNGLCQPRRSSRTILALRSGNRLRPRSQFLHGTRRHCAFYRRLLLLDTKNSSVSRHGIFLPTFHLATRRRLAGAARSVLRNPRRLLSLPRRFPVCVFLRRRRLGGSIDELRPRAGNLPCSVRGAGFSRAPCSWVWRSTFSIRTSSAGEKPFFLTPTPRSPAPALQPSRSALQRATWK